MSKRFSFITVIILALVVLTGTVSAQTITGTIKGVVSDQDGKPIPGATVTVEGPAMMGSISKQTDQNGVYWFPGLRPDRNYQVTAEIDNFATTIRIRDTTTDSTTTDSYTRMAGFNKDPNVNSYDPSQGKLITCTKEHSLS